MQSGTKLGVISAEAHGVPTVVIDESLFGYFGTGSAEETQVWVFGMIDKAAKECRMFVVKDRSAATLIPIIQKNIHTQPDMKTLIMSDGWQSYAFILDFA